MSFFGSVILLSITFLCYFYWRFKKSREFFDKNGVPYLNANVVFGNISDTFFKHKPMPILHWEMYRKLEPHKFGGYFNFHTPSIMIRDPELIQHVLIKDFQYFCDRGVTVRGEVDRLIGNTIAVQEGEKWRNLRAKLNTAFTGSKMKIMFPLVKTCGNKLTRALESMTEESIDVKDLCAKFTIDVIGTCVFGIETHSLDDPDSMFRKLGKRVFEFRYVNLILRTCPKIPSSIIKLLKLRHLVKEVEDIFISIVENTVKHREQNKVLRNDFIDLLLSLKNETMTKTRDQDRQDQNNLNKFSSQIGLKQAKSEIEMTTELMAGQCFNFFTAGFETSSTALGFLVLELAIHQDIQTKLRHEINSVINDNPEGLTYDLLREMPYVDMVITEGLRKYPATGYVSRKCTMDYKLPNTNIIIPKNTSITVPILGIHRNPKYYEKPEEFYPQHFTKEAIARRPHYTYLPFGEGPRICIGERFAKMQMKVGLVSMVRNFTFELSPKTVLPVQFQRHFLLLKAKGGIWLQCKKIPTSSSQNSSEK